MPAPKGDLRIFCESLQASSSLLGFAKVLHGKNELSRSGSPPRVVMWPIGAENGVADDRTVTIKSSWMLVTAHFWAPGPGTDAAFDLRTRWFQALRAQGDAGGYFWKCPDGESERWDTIPDDSEQGQEFEIDLLVRIDANLPAKSKGTVAATSLSRVATLTAGMLAGDVTAAVDATFEESSPTGVLHIDDEQISYSGMTATGFTGLVRGINGTTAAAHASGTAVYVSPT